MDRHVPGGLSNVLAPEPGVWTLIGVAQLLWTQIVWRFHQLGAGEPAAAAAPSGRRGQRPPTARSASGGSARPLPVPVSSDASGTRRESAETRPFGYLTISGGAENGRTVAIQLDTTIGRARRENDVVLADGKVSRRHGAIRVSQDRVVCGDLGSTNGSFLVNGLGSHRVRGAVALTDGDRVRVGSYELRFSEQSPSRARPQSASHSRALSR